MPGSDSSDDCLLGTHEAELQAPTIVDIISAKPARGTTA